jgi:hypothetical protein
MDHNRRDIAEPVIALYERVARLHHTMDDAYGRLAKALRERRGGEQSLSRAQSGADSVGKTYERLCDRICRTEATSLEGVLAKLQCATQCIRDTVPEGIDPEQACDIELRFVFAVERDVRRLIAGARRPIKRGRSGASAKRLASGVGELAGA